MTATRAFSFSSPLSLLFLCHNFLGAFATLNKKEKKIKEEKKNILSQSILTGIQESDPYSPPHPRSAPRRTQAPSQGREQCHSGRTFKSRDLAKQERKHGWHSSTSLSFAPAPRQLIVCTRGFGVGSLIYFFPKKQGVGLVGSVLC